MDISSSTICCIAVEVDSNGKFKNHSLRFEVAFWGPKVTDVSSKVIILFHDETMEPQLFFIFINILYYIHSMMNKPNSNVLITND